MKHNKYTSVSLVRTGSLKRATVGCQFSGAGHRGGGHDAASTRVPGGSPPFLTDEQVASGDHDQEAGMRVTVGAAGRAHGPRQERLIRPQ